MQTVCSHGGVIFGRSSGTGAGAGAGTGSAGFTSGAGAGAGAGSAFASGVVAVSVPPTSCGVKQISLWLWLSPSDLISTASEKVLVSLLPVIDDFERAIAANEKADNIDSIKEGFGLIYNKLVQIMKRFDVEEIQAKGEEFNTDFHEAVTHFPAQNEEDKGKVIDVTEKGYKLKDKVIRYAKVGVGQ